MIHTILFKHFFMIEIHTVYYIGVVIVRLKHK